jgi:hypothetical protein
MGYSRAYSFCAGAIEVLAGLLLCFRRTATLGALIACGVLSNVAMLNLCYDVQLKSFSLHLLLIAFVILVPDLRRLADLFILNRPTVPADLAALPAPRRAGLLLKTLLIGYALISSAGFARAAVHLRGGDAARPALYGIYRVDGLVRNGQVVPPLSTDRSRWSNRMDYDAARGAMAIVAGNEKHLLSWERRDEEDAILKGSFLDDALVVRLHRIDRGLPLLTGGFKWISDR